MVWSTRVPLAAVVLLCVTGATLALGAAPLADLTDERLHEGFEADSSVEFISRGDAQANRTDQDSHNGTQAARLHCPTDCGYPNEAMIRFLIDGKRVFSVSFWSKRVSGEATIAINVDDVNHHPSVNVTGDDAWSRHELQVDRCTQSMYLRTRSAQGALILVDDVELLVGPPQPGCFNPYSPTCTVYTVTVAAAMSTCVDTTVTVTGPPKDAHGEPGDNRTPSASAPAVGLALVGLALVVRGRRLGP